MQTTPSNTKLSTTKTLLVTAGLAVAIFAAGCGNDDEADLANGKQLFVEKCGACHTMARAEAAKGVAGPNLDDAFIQARNDGMDDATIKSVTLGQIKHPSQRVPAAARMPADIVTGMDARDVAAYVGYAAGREGKDEGDLAKAGQPAVSDKTVKADSSNTLQIDADPTGATLYQAGKATAAAGLVNLIMDNPSSVPHNIAVKGAGVDEKGDVVGKGGTSKVSAKLKAGEYTFYCTVPGHEAGGMKGTLKVS
ncbi:MAG: c-type cytochrome [Actinobacteria bacterium]|nr:c-type cytochrome [Actinomycetota bacterium]